MESRERDKIYRGTDTGGGFFATAGIVVKR